MNTEAVSCGSCGRLLDESPSLLPSERAPCPTCGSTTRKHEVHLSATAVADASFGGEITRKPRWQRDAVWLAVCVIATFTPVVLTLAFGGLKDGLLSFIVAAIGFAAGFKAATKIQEIEHF